MSQPDALLSNEHYTVILAVFPHGGKTSSLFKSHRTGIPIESFSLGNGAKPSVKISTLRFYRTAAEYIIFIRIS